MTILALDTAGPACGVCVFDEQTGNVLSASDEEIGKGHAERLMQVIEAALKSAGIAYSDLTRIVTTIGPGSFTGIRVGVATARGFGLGLAIPVIGVTTLEAILAHSLREMEQGVSRQAGAVLDAGRDQAYCLFDFDTEFGPAGTPFLAGHADLAQSQSILAIRPALCGNGSAILPERTGLLFKVLNRMSFAPIATVARIGAAKPVSDRRPEPLYLRQPDAKPQSGFILARA